MGKRGDLLDRFSFQSKAAKEICFELGRNIFIHQFVHGSGAILVAEMAARFELMDQPIENGIRHETTPKDLDAFDGSQWHPGSASPPPELFLPRTDCR